MQNEAETNNKKNHYSPARPKDFKVRCVGSTSLLSFLAISLRLMPLMRSQGLDIRRAVEVDR